MSNIISFPAKEKSNLSEFADNNITWLKDKSVPTCLLKLFDYIKSDATRQILNNFTVDNVQTSIIFPKDHDDASDHGTMTLETLLRPNWLPEFGVHARRRFLTFHWQYLDDPLLITTWPENLNQRLTDYASGQFIEVNNANLLSLAYEFLRGIENENQFRVVNQDEFDSVYGEGFYLFLTEETKTEKGYPLYIFYFDFLPILLDNIALQFWEEKLKDR